MTFIALPMSADSAAYLDEEAPLHQELASRGLRFTTPIWDDPGVDWSQFDAVLIRTTWDYVEKLAAYEAWLERVDRLTRLFNPLPIVRWNLRKRYLAQLDAAGIPCIPTVWLAPGSGPDLSRILAERGWERAFLKPEIGATASGTLRFNTDPAGLDQARAHLARHHTDMLLQPYLSTVETEGELSLMFFEGRFSHAFRKLPVPGDYRVQREHKATDHAVPAQPGERALAERVLEAARGLSGGDPLYARVDLLRDARGELRVTELEMVEPSLFLHHAPQGAAPLVTALLARLG